MIGGRRLLVTILATLLVSNAAVSGVALGASGVDNPSGIPDGQVFELSDDGQIEGWERAGFTLRTDDTDAETSVTQPATVLGERLGSGNAFTSGNDGVDSLSLVRTFEGERNPMGAHERGEDVTIALDADLAAGGGFDDLDGQDRVELVAARLRPESEDGVPTTSMGALELFSNVDAANRNASFRLLDNDASIDDSGRLSRTASFGPGHYVVFAAVHQPGRDGIETGATSGAPGLDDGNISVDGDVVLVGADTLSVQEDVADVETPDDAEPGDDLSFEIDTEDAFEASADGQVTHAVAIYQASTFEDSRFDHVVNESALGPDFSVGSDTQLEHSIDEFNGVARVEAGTTLNGNDLTDGEVRRPVSAGSAIEFFAEELDADQPNTDPITVGGESNSEYERINASVTVVNGQDREASVTVDTFGNFSETDYRYVVVSTLDDNESRTSTATGTIELDEGGGFPPGPPGGFPPGPPGDDDDENDSGPPQRPWENKTVRPSFALGNGNAAVSLDALFTGEKVVLPFGDDGDSMGPFVRLNVTSGANVTDVRIDINTSRSPARTPAVDRTDRVFQYVTVDFENTSADDIREGEFLFGLSQQRLDDVSVSPEDVLLYRYHNGSWEGVETTHRGGNLFTATSPMSSSFALGTAEPSVAVTDASLSATEIQAGETVDASAVFENGGYRDGNVTVEVTAGDSVLDTRTVDVGTNQTVSETFTVTVESAGEYEIAVGNVSAGTLSVAGTPTPTPTATPTPTPTATDSPTPTEVTETTESGGAQPTATTPGGGAEGVGTPTPTTTTESGPGFGGVLAIAALIAAGALAARRRD
jgi:PGF-CTERM protein/PGF-pre-PGF domain-containing protein